MMEAPRLQGTITRESGSTSQEARLGPCYRKNPPVTVVDPNPNMTVLKTPRFEFVLLFG